MPMPKDLKIKNIRELKKEIQRLETVNKHLRNELTLAEEEKESARKNYFDIISTMEEKVVQRTQETKNLQNLVECKSKELQLMLDSSPAMIFYMDMEQRYIRVNMEFARTLGYPINKIIGKTYKELFPGGEQSILEDGLEIIHSGQSILNISGFIDTPGGRRHIFTNKIPYKDVNGKIIGIIGFALDVTELKQAEKKKKELEEKLVQLEKMEAIGRLAGGVAHDLNNVLSAVVSYPDLLLMKLEANSPLRKSIEIIQKSGEKAAAIIEDLLTLARRSVTITEVLNLNEIVSSYLISPEHEKLKRFNSQVHFKKYLDKNLLCIKGSPLHLTKTLMNLMANAVEATQHKGTVTIRTMNRCLDQSIHGYDLSVPEGDYVVLTITDTGTGISEENLSKIFEPFYTKKVMGRGGTGLGMAVVWGTMKDHKGNINIINEEGKGTTFELFFPVCREPIPGEKAMVSIKQYVGSHERILVVDDVPEQRDISSLILTSLNYQVAAVASGEAAVEYMETNPIDLVILDMIMDPGMDGLDTYREIIKRHPGQKAIISSGYSETQRVREAQRLGAGSYVKKPYTLEKIGLAVRSELDKR
ncbi:MAG: ATP-binding protein [Acidobacteria bacterium]|jgi:PAS domain S-box-containing protein|nr:ATP-binding protein [Acidobacteriota bacterium]